MLGKIQEDLADLDKLNSSQGQLADYNLLVDKLNTDTERAEVRLFSTIFYLLNYSSKVEAECQELKAENDLASQEVEALWAEKQAREAQIQQLEVVVFGRLTILVIIITFIINILVIKFIIRWSWSRSGTWRTAWLEP